MRRLYYLTEDLEATQRIAQTLQKAGLKMWNFHVLSKDDAGLYERRIHSGNPIHSRDLIRSGERGALIGFAIGLWLGVIAVMVLDLSANAETIMQLAITLVPTLFGAWLGGLVGLSNENYKIQRFHGELESGRHLLMIDIDRTYVPMVRKLMSHFPAFEAGSDTPAILPFDRAPVI
jgi:hypothetical protein